MEYTGWWGVTEQTSKERKRDRGREKEEVESSGGTKEQNPEGGANDPRYGRAHPHLLSQSQAPPPESRVTSHRHLLRLAEVLDYHLDLANLEKLPFLIPTSCISIVHLFFYYLFTFQNWNTSLLFFLHFSSFFEYFNSIETIWNISISIRYDQCKKKREKRFEICLIIFLYCQGWFISISENIHKYYCHIICKNRNPRLPVYLTIISEKDKKFQQQYDYDITSVERLTRFWK